MILCKIKCHLYNKKGSEPLRVKKTFIRRNDGLNPGFNYYSLIDISDPLRSGKMSQITIP